MTPPRTETRTDAHSDPRTDPTRTTWLDRWLETCTDLARLQESQPMLDAVIDEIDGRLIRIGSQWLVDFASCNYLGFDLDPEIIDAIPAYLRTWGTHPSWSRLLGSPAIYPQIEDRLTDLLGCEDTLAMPTITHIHTSVIPVLAGSGTILLDARAHKTMYDGCSIARSHGATVTRYRHHDPAHVAELLAAAPPGQRLICTDGVNSMTGNAPPLRELARLARENDALLYVDDAHGFGVIGERSPTETCSYGTKGNSIVAHLAEGYDNVILVGGFSKAYSSLLAFLACSTRLKNILKITAPPYLYSGPSPVASLATVLAGFDVNERRGDQLRANLFAMTKTVLDALAARGIFTPNTSGLPIIEIPLARSEDIDGVGRFLFEHGIYVTLAAYPLVPKNEVGFRVQLTSANTPEQITLLIDVIDQLKERFPLQSACATPVWGRGR